MDNSTPEYCASLVRENNRDRFMQNLFALGPQRSALMAVVALDCELAHVHRAVSEDMLAHIRYAWWREGIEGLYTGQVRGHPVFEALAPLTATLAQEELVKLVDSYDENFPQMPQQADAILDGICLPLANAGWQKAGDIIQKHRQKFGAGNNSWLALKLLLAGLF